jgi:hypothetical protein
MFATVETVAWLWMSLGPIRLDPLAVPPPAELTAAALYSSSLSVRAAIGLSRDCTTSEATNFTRWSGVILVTAGNLYGNFVECGVDGWGGVSELTLSNGKWTQKLLQLRRRPRGWILSELRTDFRRGREPVWRNC